jgi:RNA polymerase sigma-70 factor (ECF subfamily)
VSVQHEVERLHRQSWGYVLATLIRVVGDFDLAEEAAQEAFAIALEQWPTRGMPENATAWLIQTAKHKVTDLRRRRANLHRKTEELKALRPTGLEPPDLEAQPEFLQDDRLRLIFTCCHPALAIEAQVALTLRTLCGLGTEEIARAFLVPVATMAQRIVRAKAKIRDARIPYRIPEEEQLADRLEPVTAVIYLVFNEGYFASRGEALIRRELCDEAIQLGRLLVSLFVPRVPSEVQGLLALMLLQDSRSDARLAADGELVLLASQDRSRWNQVQIAEGLPLVDAALSAPSGPGPYAVQAAIAALHARATRAADTDWKQIAVLYGVLTRLTPSAVVSLNHAVAVAMADGPRAGLELMDALAGDPALEGYLYLHVARADLLARLDQRQEAALEYGRALTLECNLAERRALEARLREVSA